MRITCAVKDCIHRDHGPAYSLDFPFRRSSMAGQRLSGRTLRHDIITQPAGRRGRVNRSLVQRFIIICCEVLYSPGRAVHRLDVPSRRASVVGQRRSSGTPCDGVITRLAEWGPGINRSLVLSAWICDVKDCIHQVELRIVWMSRPDVRHWTVNDVPSGLSVTESSRNLQGEGRGR